MIALHQKPGPCRCIGVEIQEYQGAVTLLRPPHMADPERPGLCVDGCLAVEITALWKEGIATTGCCCGHGKAPAFIGVEVHDIPRMKALGYRVQPNPCRPGDEDSFWPKSISNCPVPELPEGYRCDGCDCERADAPSPQADMAVAIKVCVEHEPCPECASVDVAPYWWARGQAWIVICGGCKHEAGRERTEGEAWNVWDAEALRKLGEKA